MRHELPEVFTPAEVARAAGVPTSDVQALVDAGIVAVLPTRLGTPLIAHVEALRVGRALASGVAVTLAPTASVRQGRLFGAPPGSVPTARVPFVISTAGHVAAVCAAVLVTTLGLGRPVVTRATEASVPPQHLQLVYLALPGPGGGGGGGGLRQPAPPPKAERKGPQSLSSPIPVRQPPPPRETPPSQPPEPEVEPEPLPPVEAPVVTVAGDARDRAGVLEELPPMQDSRGPGTGGGAGSGEGTGLGEGHGSGIGDGSGGGMGGGVYRPGSGIDPPSLLREVKPDYTEEARRRGVSGEVVMEIVVRRDGSVGDVRILQGLGYGLDGRAVAAVRQWRFAPARLRGTPVDVVVEVAMEFKLR
jgi:periplasmic protein TonB